MPNLDNYRKDAFESSAHAGDGIGGSVDTATWGNGGGDDGNQTFVETGFTMGQQTGASETFGMSETAVQEGGNLWQQIGNWFSNFGNRWSDASD
jgi:hypothetical protein